MVTASRGLRGLEFLARKVLFLFCVLSCIVGTLPQQAPRGDLQPLESCQGAEPAWQGSKKRFPTMSPGAASRCSSYNSSVHQFANVWSWPSLLPEQELDINEE
jgi:hypothetical protein